MKKPKLIVVKLRASVLLPVPVSDSEENISRYSAVFENGKTTVAKSENGYWKMENDRFEITFMNQRVDVELSCTADGIDEESRFVQMVLKLTEMIVDNNKKNPLLLSYSPLLAIDNSEEFSNKDFFDALLKVNRFHGVKPSNSEVRCSYIISRHLSLNSVETNHVISFSEGTKTVKHDGKSTDYECLIAEMEINVPSRNGGYPLDDMKVFFGQANVWRDELIDAYLDAL